MELPVRVEYPVIAVGDLHGRVEWLDKLECLRRKAWDRAVVSPKFGTETERHFNPEYPVWLGADKRLSADPLPVPGRTQVSGHVRIDAPDATPARIRIDTSDGVREPLTACLLRGPGADPVFVFSDGA